MIKDIEVCDRCVNWCQLIHFVAIYAVTARVLREELRERVRLLVEGQHVPEGDRPAWRVYPEFATRL